MEINKKNNLNLGKQYFENLFSFYNEAFFHPYPEINYILELSRDIRIHGPSEWEANLGYTRNPVNIIYHYNFDAQVNIPREDPRKVFIQNMTKLRSPGNYDLAAIGDMPLEDKARKLFLTSNFDEKFLFREIYTAEGTIKSCLDQLFASGKHVTHIACAQEEDGDDDQAQELYRNYDRVDVYEVLR